MKLRIWYAWMIALLLCSSATFGELVPIGDGRTSGVVSVAASHGNYSNSDSDSGDNGYYTTEGGYFTYYYEAKAYADTYLDIDDGWGRSVSIASASAGTQSAYKNYDFTTTRHGSGWDGPCVYQESIHFDAYTGVYASWVVIAHCEIEEGTYSEGFALSYAYAEAAMW